MTRKADEAEFDNLIKRLRNKAVIRIEEPRQKFATLHIFTLVSFYGGEPTLYPDPPTRNHIAWVSYKCDLFEAKHRGVSVDCFQINFFDLKTYLRKQNRSRILTLIDNSPSDISAIAADIDGSEFKRENNLDLVYWIHLSRLQGMMIGQCQFYTKTDAQQILVVAERIGGVVKKRLFEISSALELMKTL